MENPAPKITRRALLSTAAAFAALPARPVWSAADTRTLKSIALRKGLTFGASFSTYELDKPYGEAYAAMYRTDAQVLVSELELKMAFLRPSADVMDFAPADRLMAFAADNRLDVRGHTLIWNDGLPEWIKALSGPEVKALLEAHVLTTMERYRGRIRSWDVVNEPIGPWDRNPGNLRGGPFLAAMGEDYIIRSFKLARRADPDAQLVLNEAQTESDDENGQTFRDSFLALLKRLRDGGAPIDAIGLQGHIDTARPYDFPRFAAFVEQIAAMGYDVLITELDVNDRAIEGSMLERDKAVAAIYTGYLKAVLPVKAVRSLTLWQMADHTSWLYYGDVEKKPSARRRPRPLIYDDQFRRKPAWHALAEALEAMPPR